MPLDLSRIIEKTLAAKPADRYQHTDDIAVDLKRLEKALESGASPSYGGRVTVAGGQIERGGKRAILVTLALAIIAVAVWRIRGCSSPPTWTITTTAALTRFPGLEDSPSWSPDGSRVAYMSDELGKMDIWVAQTNGTQVQLTAEEDDWAAYPSWSPDGQSIAFFSSRDGGGIFVMPALGGFPRQVAELALGQPNFVDWRTLSVSWSPDSEHIAFTHEGRLYVTPVLGGRPQLFNTPEGVTATQVAWSPDGEYVAYNDWPISGRRARTRIWTSRRDGSAHHLVAGEGQHNSSPVWSPNGTSLLFVSDRGGDLDIWRVRLDKGRNADGDAEQLTVSAGVGTIALSGDGSRLCYSKIETRSNIYAVSTLKRGTLSKEDLRAITDENDEIAFLDVSPDGAWIAHNSTRRGNHDIWLVRRDGSEQRQVTVHDANDFNPSFSPDGEKIAFYSGRDAGGLHRSDIWVTPKGGGPAAKLFGSPGVDWHLQWSPTREEIAFSSRKTGGRHIWVVTTGGEARQLTSAGDFNDWPVWSPDGDQLAFVSNRTGSDEVFVCPARGGGAVQLTRHGWSSVRTHHWSTDGLTVYAMSDRTLWSVSVADGAVGVLLQIPARAWRFRYSVDIESQFIYFILEESRGDLHVAELSLAR